MKRFLVDWFQWAVLMLAFIGAVLALITVLIGVVAGIPWSLFHLHRYLIVTLEWNANAAWAAVGLLGIVWFALIAGLILAWDDFQARMRKQ